MGQIVVNGKNLKSTCSTAQGIGAPGEIRTPDQVVRSHLQIADKSYINQLVTKKIVPLYVTILLN